MMSIYGWQHSMPSLQGDGRNKFLSLLNLVACYEIQRTRELLEEAPAFSLILDAAARKCMMASPEAVVARVVSKDGALVHRTLGLLHCSQEEFAAIRAASRGRKVKPFSAPHQYRRFDTFLRQRFPKLDASKCVLSTDGASVNKAFHPLWKKKHPVTMLSVDTGHELERALEASLNSLKRVPFSLSLSSSAFERTSTPRGVSPHPPPL
eukprot:Sspe_Gene.44467::Locus_21804_Transcript_5_10_Confidence_0.385_Length_816::g.44467::m.44467